MSLNYQLQKLKTFCVPSKSQQNSFHFLDIWSDGFITCDCKSFEFRKNCSHKRIIGEYYGNY